MKYMPPLAAIPLLVMMTPVLAVEDDQAPAEAPTLRRFARARERRETKSDSG